MRNDVHFWIATFCRGIFALLFGSAVIVIPDMAKILFLTPFAVALSILFLATYGLVDSAIVLVTSFMAGSSRTRVALLLQGGIGATVAVLLLAFMFERTQLHWFLYAVAAQALFAALGEWTLARHGLFRRDANWNYVAASVAVAAAALYFVLALRSAGQLTPAEIAWLIFAYLIAFGMAQCLTAARMLYADHHVMLLRREVRSKGDATRHVAINTGITF